MPTNKLTRLKHLSALATRTKSELAALDTKIQEIVTVGGQPNVIEKIILNGVEQTPDENKAVSLTVTHPEYSIVKAAESGDYAAVYNLTKDGVNVGATINIPKDMVVESGAVVTDPEGQPAGTYIKLVLQNVAEPLYINVGSLIEYVTSGSAADDMVVIAVSDDHKVTATITDGSITLAKLAADVQTAIGKAHDHANKAELDLIATGDKAKWDQAVTDVNAVKADYLKAADKTALETKITDGDAATLASAKEYADGKDTAMNTRVAAIEADYLKAADKTELQNNINTVDAKFANYTNTTDMNAAIKAVDDKFANYYTSAQIDGMIATDAEVTTELDTVFGTQA